jgi:Glycosyltransferase
MLTSSHSIYDSRIYYKEILSLKKKYNEIHIIAPGESNFVTDDGVTVWSFKARKNWHDRIRPMKEMYNLALDLNADVYHAHEPDSLQVAVNIKNKTGKKIIYDSHEYYPEAFSEHFKYGRKAVQGILSAYERSLSEQADYIITVNELLENKFKRYNNNVKILRNYPVLSGDEYIKTYEKMPVFIYIGGLTRDRGILKILQSIKKVKTRCKYIFIGGFDNNQFQQETKNYINENLSNIDIQFTGKIPHMQVFKYLKQADAGFTLLQPNNLRYVNSEPIKLFEYMMSKTAVIASDFPMLSKIINNSECGIAVQPDDTQKIADVVDYIANNRECAKLMGTNGRQEVKKLYNWSYMEKRLISIYENLG